MDINSKEAFKDALFDKVLNNYSHYAKNYYLYLFTSDSVIEESFSSLENYKKRLFNLKGNQEFITIIPSENGDLFSGVKLTESVRKFIISRDNIQLIEFTDLIKNDSVSIDSLKSSIDKKIKKAS